MDAKLTIEGLNILVLDGPYTLDGKATDEARAFAKKLIAQLDEIREKIADEMLAMYNDDWRDSDDDDPEPITRGTFMERVTNPSIHLYDDMGAACIYFNDSNMFGGHAIEVFVDHHKVANIGIVG